MDDIIEDYLAVLAEEGKSPRTITDRRRCLRRLEEDLPYGILAACKEQLQSWLAGPNDPGRRWSKTTKAVYAYHVIAACAYLEEQGLFPTGNPAKGLKRPRRPRPIARYVPARVIEVALAAPEPLRTAVLLGRYQGMRRFEAAACEREHITEEETYIPDAKGGDPQVVPTHPVVWEHVRDRPPGPLIACKDGRKMTADQLGQAAMRYFRRHGLRGVGLHDLRRWFGREIYDRTGHDIRVTQEVLRHASITTTQVYVAVTAEQKTAAIRALPRQGEPEPAVIRLGHPHAA